MVSGIPFEARSLIASKVGWLGVKQTTESMESVGINWLGGLVERELLERRLGERALGEREVGLWLLVDSKDRWRAPSFESMIELPCAKSVFIKRVSWRIVFLRTVLWGIAITFRG